MEEPAVPFQDLLGQLSHAHDRELRQLHTEIERLQGIVTSNQQWLLDQQESPQGNTPTDEGSLRASPRAKFQGSLEGVSDEEPDEEALAAACAIATDVVSEDCADHEVLALWGLLVGHAKRQVQQAGLPSVHKNWKVDRKSDLGVKMKNLVAKRSHAYHKTHHFEGDEEDSEDRGPRLIARLKRSCVPTIPTHPSSKSRLFWDFLGIMLLVHDLVMIPMSLFDTEYASLPYEYDRFVEKLDYCSAVFWSCDVIINFFTGYHATSGFVEMKMWMIAKHYLQTWFPLDICIVGIDWTMTGLNQSGPTEFMRLGKTASRLTRLVRLLRFMKMNKHVSELLMRINSEKIHTMIGLMKLVIWIVILNHYIACFWFGFSSAIQKSRNVEDTWVSFYLINPGKFDLAYSYTTSLHWSLTQFTPASMEVFPKNAYERSFNVVVIICGFVIFSSFVSSITGAMNHIRSINAQALKQDFQIRTYFNDNNIPHALASRIWHFVRQKRVLGKRQRTEPLPILQELPVRLREELRLEVFTPVLTSHPLFRLYKRISAAGLRKMVIKAMTEASLPSGKELKMEESCKKMVFVVSGALEYHVFSIEEDDVPRIPAGSWACEAALWADHASMEGHLIAAPGGVDLLLLDGDSFRSIAFEFSDGSDLLARYGGIFMESFVQALMSDDEVTSENVLFNNKEAIAEMVKAATGADASHALDLHITGLRGSGTRNSGASSRGSNLSMMGVQGSCPVAALEQPVPEQVPIPAADKEAVIPISEDNGTRAGEDSNADPDDDRSI